MDREEITGNRETGCRGRLTPPETSAADRIPSGSVRRTWDPKATTVIPKGKQTVSGEYGVVENGLGGPLVGLHMNLIGKQFSFPTPQGTNASAAALAVPLSKDTQPEPRRRPPYLGRSSLDRQR